MSDRTYASITYPAWADILIADYYVDKDLDRFWGDDRIISESLPTDEEQVFTSFTWVGASECNYGQHPLQDVLYKLEIPFDNEWYEGGNYGPGRGVMRRDVNGEMVHQEVENLSDANRLVELVHLYQTEGSKSALDMLDALSGELRFSARPIGHVPPTAEQIDRIISLLCDGPDRREENLEKAA